MEEDGYALPGLRLLIFQEIGYRGQGLGYRKRFWILDFGFWILDFEWKKKKFSRKVAPAVLAPARRASAPSHGGACLPPPGSGGFLWA